MPMTHKYSVTLIVTSTLLIACASTKTISPGTGGEGRISEAAPVHENPCTDSLYVALKSKSLDEMSEREYEYFMRKDADCSEYQRSRMMTHPAEKSAEAAEKAVQSNTRALTTILTLSLFGSIVTAILLLAQY